MSDEPRVFCRECGRRLAYFQHLASPVMLSVEICHCEASKIEAQIAEVNANLEQTVKSLRECTAMLTGQRGVERARASAPEVWSPHDEASP